MSTAKVKLLYDGPGEVTNLDVAAETGDGRLEPGREIAVSTELAELLERSTPYWTRATAAKPKRKRKAKNTPKATATPVSEPASDEAAPQPSEEANG